MEEAALTARRQRAEKKPARPPASSWRYPILALSCFLFAAIGLRASKETSYHWHALDWDGIGWLVLLWTLNLLAAFRGTARYPEGQTQPDRGWASLYFITILVLAFLAYGCEINIGP